MYVFTMAVFNSEETKNTKRYTAWFQFLRGIKHGSTSAGLLESQVRNPPGHGCLSLVRVWCCQVQDGPEESYPSVVFLSVISKPQQWGGLSSLGLSSREIQQYRLRHCLIFLSHDFVYKVVLSQKPKIGSESQVQYNKRKTELII
jgi:hypothetical protein